MKRMIPCREGAFVRGRGRPVEYIVAHGGRGMARPAPHCAVAAHAAEMAAAGAPAATMHYYVSGSSVVQSVADGDAALHCAGSRRRGVWIPEPKDGGDPASPCGDTNSVGVMLCCSSRGEEEIVLDKTAKTAALLIASLMERHGVPWRNVVRAQDIGAPHPLFEGEDRRWRELLRRLAPPLPRQAPREAIRSLAAMGLEGASHWRRTPIPVMAELLRAVCPTLDPRVRNGVWRLPQALRVLGDMGAPGGEAAWRAAVEEDPLAERAMVLLADKTKDVLWRIAEAEGKGLECRAMVAGVVLERSASGFFPDGAWNVVFQEGQFASVADGRYRKASPGDEAKAAVEIALGGGAGGALFFRAARGLGAGSWHERTLIPVRVSGGLKFYK